MWHPVVSRWMTSSSEMPIGTQFLRASCPIRINLRSGTGRVPNRIGFPSSDIRALKERHRAKPAGFLQVQAVDVVVPAFAHCILHDCRSGLGSIRCASVRLQQT